MKNLRNFESIWLHNLNKLFSKFVALKSASLTDAYKLSTAVKPIDVQQGVNSHLVFGINALTLEVLTLTTENFQKNGLNFGDPKINKLLREIKLNLPAEYQSLNGAEFLKLLRTSIAHNSNDKQNLKAQNLFDYQVLLAKKGVSTPSNYTFSQMDLIKILEIYDTSRIMEQEHGCLLFDEEYNSPDKLLYGKKKLGSFSKFMVCQKADGQEVPIDQYQDATFQRFLIKHKADINKYGKFEHFITRYFPVPDNKFNNYEHKSHLLMSMIQLFNVHGKITCNDMVKNLKSNRLGGILPFLDAEFMQSLLYSSLAFNIFSSHTNEELHQLFIESKLNVDNDTIRHLRNSFIHGRYFYNYKNGFEIYDGNKELTHITTFDFNTLDQIYETYSKDTKKFVIKERIRLGYEEPEK